MRDGNRVRGPAIPTRNHVVNPHSAEQTSNLQLIGLAGEDEAEVVRVTVELDTDGQPVFPSKPASEGYENLEVAAPLTIGNGVVEGVLEP